MRKSYAWILAILIFLVPLCASSESSATDHYDNARQIADDMEAKYHITILIGPECNAFNFDDAHVSLGNEYKKRSIASPLLNMLYEQDYYAYELRLLDKALSFYPKGFFDLFFYPYSPDGLRILITNQLTYKGFNPNGIAAYIDNHFCILLGAGYYSEKDVHHELWHIIEKRILYYNPKSFEGWSELNPEGIEYTNDYHYNQEFDPESGLDQYFVMEYSTCTEHEDRATIISALFTKGIEWINEHPVIREKLDRMQRAARPLFGANLYNIQ